MRSILPRVADSAGRVARRVGHAALIALAVALTGAWGGALVWALTLIPAIVWAALAGGLAAYLLGLRLWCDLTTAGGAR